MRSQVAVSSYDDLACGCPRYAQNCNVRTSCLRLQQFMYRKRIPPSNQTCVWIGVYYRSYPTSQSARSLCSWSSSGRGDRQRVVAFSVYGPFSNPYHYAKYWSQVEPRVLDVTEKYPGWILRLYHNITKMDREPQQLLCSLYCKYPNFDLCNADQIFPNTNSIQNEDQISDLSKNIPNRKIIRKSSDDSETLNMKLQITSDSKLYFGRDSETSFSPSRKENFTVHKSFKKFQFINKLLKEEDKERTHLHASYGDLLVPSMWRFLPMADPSVAEFLVRDIDSTILVREVDAVRQWLDHRTAILHVMRDHPSHNGAILAGMWGGSRTRGSTRLKDLFEKMIRWPPRQLWDYDQRLLQRVVWPDMKDSVARSQAQTQAKAQVKAQSKIQKKRKHKHKQKLKQKYNHRHKHKQKHRRKHEKKRKHKCRQKRKQKCKQGASKSRSKSTNKNASKSTNKRANKSASKSASRSATTNTSTGTISRKRKSASKSASKCASKSANRSTSRSTSKSASKSVNKSASEHAGTSTGTKISKSTSIRASISTNKSVSRSAIKSAGKARAKLQAKAQVIHDSYYCQNSLFTANHRSLAFPSQRVNRTFVSWGVMRDHEKKSIVPCPKACRPRNHKDWTYC
ncbi:hypothetical protein FHG87_013147 [Trinorchestia longiramus]|nr:hypothetical protein FHG87_013147 [Trinorchestia longiramus]